jgi:hypothetical protein
MIVIIISFFFFKKKKDKIKQINNIYTLNPGVEVFTAIKKIREKKIKKLKIDLKIWVI